MKSMASYLNKMAIKKTKGAFSYLYSMTELFVATIFFLYVIQKSNNSKINSESTSLIFGVFYLIFVLRLYAVKIFCIIDVMYEYKNLQIFDLRNENQNRYELADEQENEFFSDYRIFISVLCATIPVFFCMICGFALFGLNLENNAYFILTQVAVNISFINLSESLKYTKTNPNKDEINILFLILSLIVYISLSSIRKFFILSEPKVINPLPNLFCFMIQAYLKMKFMKSFVINRKYGKTRVASGNVGRFKLIFNIILSVLSITG